MKKANPCGLRIGNIVVLNGRNKRISGIGEKFILSEEMLYRTEKREDGDISPDRRFALVMLPYADILGVELTEEVLLKCGFEEVYKSEFTQKLELSKCVNIEWKRTLKLNTGTISFSNLSMPSVQSLHQLQNLYFCLAGKELEVELSKIGMCMH